MVSIVFVGMLNAQSDFEFPYQALVLRDGAKVHSGPGRVHYGTAALEQGEVVEVYEHDPGGWCAIRPPAESFSLVPQGTLQIVGDGVGQIKTEGTKAWVGTKLGPVEKPLWQVKLKRGEMVEVLGQINWPNPEGHSTIWYQIAPPPGEFRWIQMSNIQLPAAVRLEMRKKDLERDYLPVTDSGSQEIRSLVELPIDRNAAQSDVRQASLEVNVAPQPEGPKNNGWRQATRPIRNRSNLNRAKGSMTSARMGNDLGYPNARLANDSNNRPSTQTSSSRPAASANIYDSRFGKSPDQRYLPESKPAEVPFERAQNIERFAEADLSSGNLASRLDRIRESSGLSIPNQANLANLANSQISDLELALTREMVKSPTDWRLDDLELRATSLFRSSTNSSERALADKFLTKIENCRKVQTGYKSGLNITPTARSASSRQTRPIGTGVQQDIALGATYDAHGWLNQLVRDGGQSQPEYVLQDANGKVTHHVRPIQGMNLHRYLKSRIGVVGQRGYHNRLKLDHVTVHRVVELEKPRR